jgi:hypothetical protein
MIELVVYKIKFYKKAIKALTTIFLVHIYFRKQQYASNEGDDNTDNIN